MDLRRIVELIRQLEKELVLFNVDPADSVDTQLSAHFKTQNVTISTTRTASGQPTDVGVLSNDSEVLAVVDVDVLRDFIDHSPSQSNTVGISDARYEMILSHLKETTFSSHDTADMLYASREIEDRARRVGTGVLHAGFQQCSLMAEQQSIYTDLARRGLEVHAYGVPDTTPPDLGEAEIHTPNTDEIAQLWFVVFDGGGEDTQKTALIAEEVDTRFYGGWTYDPSIVDAILDHLKATYLSNDDVTPHTDT